MTNVELSSSSTETSKIVPRTEITAVGGQPRLTQFAGTGHDCWEQAVFESPLLPWMLQQRRGYFQSTAQARALAFPAIAGAGTQ